MKRILLIAVVCVFIVSTLGVATASATQLGHSPVYYFNVAYNGKVTGYVIIDTAPKAPTYTFVGWGLTANQKYDLWYTTTVVTPFRQLTELHYVGNGTTNRAGVLMTHGDVAISQHELQMTTFQLSPVGAGNLPPLVAVLSVSDGPAQSGGHTYYLNATSSTGDIVRYTLDETFYVNGMAVWQIVYDGTIHT